jgi:glucan phosphorylase
MNGNLTADQIEDVLRVAFLADYVRLADRLVQGVDLWMNTPRPPWEACGTRGMKVLVNGGLNLSFLDGWWEEAYRPELGWAPAGNGQDETGCDGSIAKPMRYQEFLASVAAQLGR